MQCQLLRVYTYNRGVSYQRVKYKKVQRVSVLFFTVSSLFLFRFVGSRHTLILVGKFDEH